MEPEELFVGHPVGLAILARVRLEVEAIGPVTVRASRSQVAFRRVRGFAWLWRPGQYLARPGAEAVLSLALGRRDPSPRFKEVVHPSPRHWLHHLEVDAPEAIDDEVRAWLREAAGRSG
ncbi:MAG: DUF5655 domain-containing protein [Chloroflexi bacterium]|nr:DUF5655 domain-containing protein [Chloroflexota bacterium]